MYQDSEKCPVCGRTMVTIPPDTATKIIALKMRQSGFSRLQTVMLNSIKTDNNGESTCRKCSFWYRCHIKNHYAAKLLRFQLRHPEVLPNLKWEFMEVPRRP